MHTLAQIAGIVYALFLFLCLIRTLMKSGLWLFSEWPSMYNSRRSTSCQSFHSMITCSICPATCSATYSELVNWDSSSKLTVSPLHLRLFLIGKQGKCDRRLWVHAHLSLNAVCIGLSIFSVIRPSCTKGPIRRRDWAQPHTYILISNAVEDNSILPVLRQKSQIWMSILCYLMHCPSWPLCCAILDACVFPIL